MRLYSSNDEYKLYEGNMLDMLEVIEPNSIDSIITDPPYGLTSIVKRFGKEDSAEAQYGKDGSFQRLSKGFMGKEWDGSGVEYNVEAWKKCYQVLKPGGYLLAFGGSRTFHRIACAIEDAGFEIRDTIMWLYGSGFPKSLNIGLAIDKKNGVESKVIGTQRNGSSPLPGNHKEAWWNNQTDGIFEIKEAQNEWKGWGTQLKPSYEPIIVARKPVENTVVDNVLKYGVGGINIDECRVGTEKIGGGTMPDLSYVGQEQKKLGNGHKMNFGQVSNAPRIKCEEHEGRFPANTILTYDETDFNEVCGGFPKTKSVYEEPNKNHTFKGNKDAFQYGYKDRIGSGYEDSGSAARYFYCAKASKKDRDDGLNEFENVSGANITGRKEGSAGLVMEGGKQNPYAGKASPNNKNTHPTVKPMELMQYLIRLVTPKGGGHS